MTITMMNVITVYHQHGLRRHQPHDGSQQNAPSAPATTIFDLLSQIPKYEKYWVKII